MIVRMAKVRVLGPRERLDDLLRVVQDFGLVHLVDVTPPAGTQAVELTARDLRRRRQLLRVLDDVEVALGVLGEPRGGAALRPERGDAPPPLGRWARQARRARRAAEELVRQESALAEERSLILKYRDFLEAFRPLLTGISRANHLVTHAVLVPAPERAVVERLAGAVESGQEFVVHSRPLRNGDLAVLIIMPARSAERVERLLTEARLPEIPVPAAYGGRSLAEAVPLMLSRLESMPREEEALARVRADLAKRYAAELVRARRAVHDALGELEAREHCATTTHAFMLEGFVPEVQSARLAERVAGSFAGLVVVQEIATEEWAGEPAPVVLHNPRLFRPFEAIIRILPLPRYGSIDPTPFVAVFFPMLFGIIVGDLAYGLVLAGIALALRARSREGTLVRTIAEIAMPCAAFTIIFGVLFGEFLGDVGHRFGMHPVLFNREEAVVAFLAAAVALGTAHIVLGLVLGILSRWQHHRRHAIGSGAMLVMVLMVVVALLTTVDLLPKALFTPAVVALLIAFPVLVATEGIIAPVEFLATLGNILSYARIMALGTAGVMLAVVANRMVGAFGSTVIGVLFALLFHLVNFAIALFSPSIHALRLHYVEFFGKFYSSGGVPYRPFGHWSPGTRR